MEKTMKFSLLTTMFFILLAAPSFAQNKFGSTPELKSSKDQANEMNSGNMTREIAAKVDCSKSNVSPSNGLIENQRQSDCESAVEQTTLKSSDEIGQDLWAIKNAIDDLDKYLKRELRGPSVYEPYCFGTLGCEVHNVQRKLKDLEKQLQTIDRRLAALENRR